MTFDPEGDDYDMDTAVKAGLKADETGHWPSREPKSGLILKGRKHKTFHLTLQADKEKGYAISKGKDGRYYSRKIEKTPEEEMQEGYEGEESE